MLCSDMESEIFKTLTRILKAAELSSLSGGYIYDIKMRPQSDNDISKLRKILISEGNLTVYHLNIDTGDLVKYSVTPERQTRECRPLTVAELSNLQDNTIEILYPEIFKKKFRRIKWSADLLFSTVV